MKSNLLGLNIDTISFEQALNEANKLIEEQRVAQIITINPEMFEEASKNEEFANIVREAELVIADGIGVKIALKINGIDTDKIPGIDFAKKMLEITAQKNLPVAIIGAKEEVLIKAIENLKQEIAGLNIVYYHNGYFKNDDEIYQELNNNSPRLVLIAMGSPRQEEFIYNAKKVLKPALMIGIGGSLDVWSGYIKRAPKFFQILGLEWLYRTITQPARFKRIFPTLPLFIIKAFKYKFSK